MKGMLAGALSPQQASAEDFEHYKQEFIDEVAHLCGGEEVLAAAMFRQGGAAGHQAAMRAAGDFGGIFGGLLAKKVGDAARKKRAGGLPKVMILAVTPRRLVVFDASYRISARRKERENGTPAEVAAWDRDAVSCTIGRSGTMSTLKIESLDGPSATVVGGSSADDPWSREVMDLLAGVPAVA